MITAFAVVCYGHSLACLYIQDDGDYLYWDSDQSWTQIDDEDRVSE